MSRDTKIIAGVVVGLIVALCCCMLAVAGLGATFLVIGASSASEFLEDVPPFIDTPPYLLTDEFSETPIPFFTATPEGPQATPTPRPADDTLQTLSEATIEPRDLRALVERFKGIDIPATVSAQPADHQVGDVVEFTASNTDTNEPFTVKARLVYRTDNAYFFADEEVAVNEDAVKRLMDDFQQNTYPTNREFFGSEWNPGVDGDPRLYILFARGLGFNLLGYYSSDDEYSKLANENSNEKEIFFINADNTSPSDPDLASTLAHEFQHMIHWAQDINEETWMNEGASMLAEALNDVPPDSYAEDFTNDPDLQLTAWDGDDSLPHYGAGYLFWAYFLDRFGEETTKALVAEDANGMAAVDNVLAATGQTDLDTSEPLTAEELFADWVIANYINDADFDQGQFGYPSRPNLNRAETTDVFYDCPVRQQATVHQFGTDYYRLECQGTFTLNFTGGVEVNVVPVEIENGQFAMYGHRSDESMTGMRREFDLSGVSAATLRYNAWWDIEEGYDYGYVNISTDGGNTWQTLKTPGGTDEDPNGANLGWGYTAQSDGWRTEEIDLSDYAGQKIWLSFEYITDAALNMPGLLIDDVEIPELNYAEDFENGTGDWETSGFVRMDNTLSQRFVVQIIRRDGNRLTGVERVELDDANRGSFTLTINSGETATLVVSGTTTFTTEATRYEFEVK